MSLAATAPLFYSSQLARAELLQLVLSAAIGTAEPPPLDTVELPDEDGGEAARELGLPLLPGMDEVQVDEARLVLRAEPREMEVTTHTVTNVAAGANQGTVVALAKPSRLRKVELTYTVPAGTSPRLVVRPAEKQGNAFSFGAPIYAAPDFPPPGPMYGRVLSGLAVQDLGGDRRLATFPNVLGSAWLFQLATGDSPTELSAQAFQPQVGKVVIQALPRDLALELAPSGGGPGIPLWSHPDLLLPETGEQEVHFTPLAQKTLAEELAARSGEAGAVTLPVPLRFRATSGGAVGITARSLAARYVVRPLGPDPATLRLDGGWSPLGLDAPAALTPAGSAVRVTAKLLGRELNAGSPEPPVAPPGGGLRVSAERAVATALRFLPDEAGRRLPLASVRLYLAAPEDAEGTLEIREDTAGAPGPPLAAPIVRQVPRGASGWIELELTAPLAVEPGDRPLWLTLRVTRGQLFWFGAPGAAPSPDPGGVGAPVRVSPDQGRTWGSPEEALATLATGGGPLLAQLFHAVPDPLPRPVVRLHRGAALLAGDWLSALQPTAQPREYRAEAAVLPAAVLAGLAAVPPTGPGAGRVRSELRLFSRSVLDLTLEGMTLFYDPFGAGRP